VLNFVALHAGMSTSVGPGGMPAVHVFNPSSGAPITYSLRGLRSATEVPEWAAFCARCFSYKAVPPSSEYFRRHFINDPDRRHDLVRVACEVDTGDIVGSVRVFIRTVSSGGRPHRAAGLGEVCTTPGHRRRGISGALLADALAAADEAGLRLSLLHAAPDFRPFYARAGFRSVRSGWATARVAVLPGGGAGGDDGAVVPLEVSPKTAPVLALLHRAYSEERFEGCVVRSDAYWRDYMPGELGAAVCLLRRRPAAAAGDGTMASSIVAWCALRDRGGGSTS